VATGGCGRTEEVIAADLPSEKIGLRIREARLARGWTHEELARRMGANWRTVQRWQKGKLPRLPTLLRLADVLGVPHAYFVDVEDSPAMLDDLLARVDELTARVDTLGRALSSIEQELVERDHGRRRGPSRVAG
jgi:transcriptional regulator with XRE-family HTH domain